MMPWERFARRRLALTRWQCEPENIPAHHQQAFDHAWARQRRLEQAVVDAADKETVLDGVQSSVAPSLATLLDDSGFSHAERLSVIEHHTRMEMQFARIAMTAPVPDDEQVENWYQRHQAQFMRPEQRLTSHLLLTVDHNDAAVRKLMRRFYQEISRSRNAFSQLAGRYSHCPSALEGGHLGWIGRGLLYPELETALFALQENAISQPVETALGWHLLWCEQIRPPAPIPRAEALEKTRDYLRRQYQQQWQRQWLAELAQDG